MSKKTEEIEEIGQVQDNTSDSDWVNDKTGDDIKWPEDPVNPNEVEEEDLDEEFEDESEDTSIQAGKYAAVTLEFDKTVSNNGNDQYEINFKILNEEYYGRKIRGWFSLVPKARWHTDGVLEALGIIPDIFKDPDTNRTIKKFKFSRRMIVGKPCIIELKENTYQQKTNIKIANVLPPDDEAVQLALEEG